jgi:hypothetical protein
MDLDYKIDKNFWEELIAYIRYDTDFMEKDASSNFSIVSCIRCRGNALTEPLSSNDRGIHLHTQTDQWEEFVE